MRHIAHMHSDLPQKFGIPRNSFLAPHVRGRIVLASLNVVPAAVAGLDVAFTVDGDVLHVVDVV